MTSAQLRAWTRPTLLGPFVPCWALVTLAAMAGQLQAMMDMDQWSLAMLVASAFAAAVAFCLIGVDVLLLRWRLRRLPTGFRAWFSSIVAPFATIVTASLLPVGESIPRVVLTIAAAFWLGALAVRLVFGQKPTG